MTAALRRLLQRAPGWQFGTGALEPPEPPEPPDPDVVDTLRAAASLGLDVDAATDAARRHVGRQPTARERQAGGYEGSSEDA